MTGDNVSDFDVSISFQFHVIFPHPHVFFPQTQPGMPIVSSIFFMCLPDKVLVYGDCAINTNPTAEELAVIAMSSADTAAAFGIEPRVALLSYATGDSNAGWSDHVSVDAHVDVCVWMRMWMCV